MKRLIDLREKHGWTQKELAENLDVSPSTIGMYEQGRRVPDVDTLIKIATVFDVSLDYLTGLGSKQAEDTLHNFVWQKECSTLYKRIADLRKTKGMSQRDLAKNLGVSNGAVGMWESGKRTPPIEILVGMCDCFGVSMDYLVGRTKDKRHDESNAEQETKLPICMNAELSVAEQYKRILFAETLPSIAKAVSVLQIDLFAVPENIANDVLELYMDEQLNIFSKLRNLTSQTNGDRKE